MDIERLTKMQTVLLTLLVSFVTSMATGIVTVTLMDQAPPAITQTLNRVVERTVERVVPDESQGASVITKEITVVVKEDDLITDSINKNSKSLVRIRKNIDGVMSNSLTSLGIIVSEEGLVATDSPAIDENSSYVVEMHDGTIFGATTLVIEDEGAQSLVLLSIEVPKEEEIVFNAVDFSNTSSIKLGQTVIALTGESETDIAVGVISGFVEDTVVVSTTTDTVENTSDGSEENEKEITTVLSYVKTNLNKEDILVGSPLVNMFGEIVGIATSDSLTKGSTLFVPVIEIRSALGAVIAQDSGADSEESLEE